MKSILAALLLLLGASQSLAQNGASPGTKPTVPDTDMEKKNGDLSDKLNSTNGVIHPEGNVDPAIRRPPPQTGATPVIPPPGAPGGAKDVQPK